MTDNRLPAPVLWKGIGAIESLNRNQIDKIKKAALAPVSTLWPASTNTWDAYVDDEGDLTLTHNDGTTTKVTIGQHIGIREKRLAVVRPVATKKGNVE